MLLQLIGWGPDLDPATPGVLLGCSNIIPRQNGFGVMPTPEIITAVAEVTGYARTLGVARSGTTQHAVAAVYESDASATTCTLYEFTETTGVTARAVCTAGTYTTPVMFRQFDADMFAARAGDPLRYAAINADFGIVTAAPSCSLIEATNDFLIAFNTADGFDWHCSAIGDPLDWTPSVSNQCARGRLYNARGPIVAVGKFSEQVVMCTETQTWLGRYVGAPEVWQWEQLSNDVGCVGPEAITETPFGVVWLSKNDVHIFNGTSISALNTAPVRRTMFSLLARNYIAYSQCAWDSRRQALWLMYPADGAARYTTRPFAVVYHFETQKWGAGTVIDNRCANMLPSLDWRFGSSTDKKDDMLLMTGQATSRLKRADASDMTGIASVTTGYIGDMTQKTMIRAVRPKYSRKGATTATVDVATRLVGIDTGSAVNVTGVVLDADQKFPLRQTGRWHQVTVRMNNTDILHALDIDLAPVGTR